MGINKVDQKSVSYNLLYFFVKIWHHFFFYRKVEISNLDRVPQKGAIIFTPNHQNALMDALALLFGINRTLVFLARADMFKKSFIAEILYFLRILPVFRPRDGHNEVKKNQETFDKTTEVLQKSLGLVIFPEGNHGDKHTLRSLKKGFARIAYQTEEGNDYSLDMKIIPMGILYSNYQDCRSILSINYGHPFSLSPYYEDYRTNPAIAYNKASVALSNEMKKYMVHIEDDKYYDSIDFLQTHFAIQILGDEYKSFTNRIESSRKAVDILNNYKASHTEIFEDLHRKTLTFLQKSKMLNDMQKYLLIEWKWETFLLKSLLFLFILPILLASYIVTILPLGLSLFATSFIKDPQFKSSIKFAVSLVLFPLFYFIEQLVFNYLRPNCPWYKFLIIYAVSTIVISLTGAWLRRYFGRFKIVSLRIFQSKRFFELQRIITEIKADISKIE